MHTLNYIGGEKGGVGKSFLTRTILQYMIDHQLPFIAVDTDRSNPDVKRCFDSVCTVKLAVLSEAERLEDSANAIFNAALEQDVFCNLPAQVAPALHRWIEDNQLVELAEEADIRMRLLHVSDAGYDSLKLFKRSLQLFGQHIEHVLVQNRGMTEDFEPVSLDDELQAMLAEHNVVVIDLPRFIGNADRNFIDRHSLSFGEAREHPDLGLISRQRVKTFLRKAYQAFDAAALFRAEESVMVGGSDKALPNKKTTTTRKSSKGGTRRG